MKKAIKVVILIIIWFLVQIAIVALLGRIDFCPSALILLGELWGGLSGLSYALMCKLYFIPAGLVICFFYTIVGVVVSFFVPIHAKKWWIVGAACYALYVVVTGVGAYLFIGEFNLVSYAAVIDLWFAPALWLGEVELFMFLKKCLKTTKQNRTLSAVLIFTMLFALVGCSTNRKASSSILIDNQDETHFYTRQDCNSVYYWKTRFSLTLQDESFLKEYKIGRIYLRYFDVDVSTDVLREKIDIVPIGSVFFDSRKPEGVEIVPTVFVTPQAINQAATKGGINDLAGKLATRVLNMTDYNDMGPIHEVQLDCDWTAKTQSSFFDLCASLRKLLDQKGIKISATIRLHQLKLPTPPVDRGVLMLYNTGAIRNPATHNSILDEKDVNLYLKGRIVRYSLPLDFAYPTYSWGVWFRDGEMQSLLHRSDYSNPGLYADKGDGWVEVTIDHMLEGHHLRPGDRIRTENAPYSVIEATSKLIQAAFPNKAHSNILYHLDSSNLLLYSHDEIQSIFDY